MLLIFLLESPSSVLGLLKNPLKEHGITYSKMEGGLLSGFVLKDVNYNDQVKAKEVSLKVDFEQLKNRVLYIDNLILNDAEVDKEFLASLIDSNTTEENKSESNISLPFDRVVVNNADISLKNIAYQEYLIHSFKLHLNQLDTDMKTKHEGDVTLWLDSNMAQADVNATFKDENYRLAGVIEAERAFIEPFVAEQNLSFLSNPKLTIKVDGDLQKIDYDVTLHRLDLKQNEYEVHSKTLHTFGDYSIEKKDVVNSIKTEIVSNVGDLNLDAHTTLNLDDLNNTLLFDVDSTFKPKNSSIVSNLKEQNITIKALPTLRLFAKGEMKNVEYKATIKGLKAKQNEMLLNLKDLELKGTAKPLKGDVQATLMTLFDSSVADGKIAANTTLNYKDVNNTLNFESKADLKVHDKYVNTFLKDTNVTLQGDSEMSLEVTGGMKELTAQVDVSSKVLVEKIRSSITLKTTPIKVNLQRHQVEGSFKLDADAKNIGLKVDSEFEGDYLKPETMITKSKVAVNRFNAFGVNLSTLTPLNLNVSSSENGAEVALNSKKIKLTAKSSDYDHFKFDIKTDKIYLDKLVNDLPKEPKKKFIKVNLAGEATVSKEFLILKGYIESNKAFKVVVDAKNTVRGLDVDLHTKHLKVTAKGNIKEKNIEAAIDIDSVTKVQEEFAVLYPFTVTPVNGPLNVKAIMKGEEVFATVTSPKLKMEGFNVESLDVDAHYKEELLTLNKLSFKTRGFKDAKLNKDFYLNQKGKIHLGKKRDVFIDMHPKILVKGEGTAENLSVDLRVESLSLGHPDYGSMILSSQMTYEQRGKKKKIVGGVSLEKMKLFYEAKFLDAAHDPDVVVITKKDKKKKKESDSFLEDMFIDLDIYAPDAQYKTRDIDLEFTVAVKAKKSFGKNLGLLGKVREINGRVEQAPKLFTVVDSNIVFRGTKEINPLLDIRVEHQLPDVLITISIHGDANRPKLDFASDPSMAKKDILSYLLLGVSTANLAEGGGSLGREAQLFIMNQAARDFAYEVELDRVFIKDDGTGEGYAVQAGKKLNKDTMFIIENSKEGNSFILEYEVSKSIKVELGQHQKTVPSQSIDLFFRKRFK